MIIYRKNTTVNGILHDAFVRLSARSGKTPPLVPAFSLLFLLLSLFAFSCVLAKDAAPPVFDLVAVNAAITPPAAEYVEKCIVEAKRSNAAGIIIRMDTPGGLDTAMRDIAKSILNAPLPVVVYVAPPGARAASAGVIIVVSAHVAAMSPGTNIGAAHPVGIGIGGKMDKTMSRKVENDAVAYVQGIAKKRGRNEAWVEKAVRKSESITAEEAFRLNVIDIVAADIPSLLKQIDGRKVDVNGRECTISTVGAVVREKTMGARDRILAALGNPNIAYILFLIGLAGLYFEFSTPGAILPGVVGGISLILAFFAMQTLSINYAGIALIIFALILFIAEIKIVSHGILSIGGVIALLLGSLLLFNVAGSSLRVSWGVLIPAVAVTSLFFMVVVGMAIRVQLRPGQGGSEGMTGQEGGAVSDIFHEGRVIVAGEYWNAGSDVPISAGSNVRVVGVEHLKLRVEPAEK